MAEGLSRFTPREKEILSLVVEGKTNWLIAIELGISIKTVDAHVSRMLLKSNLSNRKQLINEFGGWVNSKDNNQESKEIG